MGKDVCPLSMAPWWLSCRVWQLRRGSPLGMNQGDGQCLPCMALNTTTDAIAFLERFV